MWYYIGGSVVAGFLCWVLGGLLLDNGEAENARWNDKCQTWKVDAGHLWLAVLFVLVSWVGAVVALVGCCCTLSEIRDAQKHTKGYKKRPAVVAPWVQNFFYNPRIRMVAVRPEDD